jgi:hypothetical protein
MTVMTPQASPPSSILVNPGGSHGDPSHPQRPQLATACGLLALVMILPLIGLVAWGYSRHGQPGVIAAVVAVLVCWLSATIALVLAGLLAGTPLSLQGQLASVFPRTLVPILFAIFFEMAVPPLAQAGIFGMMVPAYLVALTTETLLSIWLTGSPGTVAKAS